MSVLRVLACGPATSVQDGGRAGWQRYGLSASGPMDPLAFAAANVLLGNPPGTAAIELGPGGGRFRAEGGALRLALTGAVSAASVEGAAMAWHRSFVLREGETLRIAPPREGVFATLGIGGGLDLPSAMGSLALHRRAALGGLDGRPLREGDALPVAGEAPSGESDLRLDPVPLERDRPVRVVLGPQADRFTEAGLATLLDAEFRVSGRADRMGYQLDGPAVAHGEGGFNIVSDGTVPGSIQVPGEGRPIVLMADRQTTGGYPKIATVISADLRRIAQRRPGDRVRFEAVEVATAVRLARERAAWIASLPERLSPAGDALDRMWQANLAGDAVDALREPD